jgi:hypothetical protein
VKPSNNTWPARVATAADASPDSKRAIAKTALDKLPSKGVKLLYAFSIDSTSILSPYNID